jgi:hypothetical protein
VSFLIELDAFYTEHRRCGELDAGLDESMVWFDCECGAGIVRQVAEEERAAVKATGRASRAVALSVPEEK